MAVRSKTWVCSRLISIIAGSNPAEGMDVRLLCLSCRVGSGLCDGLITRSEDSYPWCVCVCIIVCDIETSRMRCPRT